MINAHIILCKCAKVHKFYAMRTEEAPDDKWNINWAFALSDKIIKAEKYEETTIKGYFNLTKDYPGCPYCGNKNFFSCGICKKLTCWDGITKTVECAHCGKISEINGTISKLNTGEDI